MKNKFIKLTAILTLAVASLFIYGCATKANLDPAGAYNGDTYLYNIDETIVNSYNLVDTFLVWEEQNNAYIKVNLPSVFSEANTIRVTTPPYIKTIKLFRDAYVNLKGSTNTAAFATVSNNLQNATSQLSTQASSLQTEAQSTALAASFTAIVATNTPATLSTVNSVISK